MTVSDSSNFNDKKTYLIFSAYGGFYGIAKKLQEEGNTVFFETQLGAENFKKENIQPCECWQEKIAQSDIFIFDSANVGGYADIAKRLIQSGKVVIGGLKGMVNEIDKPLPNAHHIIIGGWFNGKDWIEPFTHSFVYNRLMNEGLGIPSLMGDVTWLCEEDVLIKELLLPQTEYLRNGSFIGYFAAEVLVNEYDLQLIQYSSELDSDSLISMKEIFGCSWTELFERLTMRRPLIRGMRHSYGMTTRVTKAPYPEFTSAPQLIFEPQTQQHVHEDLSMFRVSAWGGDVREAQKRIRRTLNKMTQEDKTEFLQYRTDIGNKAEKKINDLKNWGWIF